MSGLPWRRTRQAHKNDRTRLMALRASEAVISWRSSKTFFTAYSVCAVWSRPAALASSSALRMIFARSSSIGLARSNALSYSAFRWRRTVSAEELLIWFVVLVLATVLTFQAL